MNRFPEMKKLFVEKRSGILEIKIGVSKQNILELLQFLYRITTYKAYYGGYTDEPSLISKETITLLHTVFEDSELSLSSKQLLCGQKKSLADYLYTLQVKQELCDITFEVEKQKIMAHRCIVFNRCEVLKTFFGSELSLNSKEEVHSISN